MRTNTEAFCAAMEAGDSPGMDIILKIAMGVCVAVESLMRVTKYYEED